MPHAAPVRLFTYLVVFSTDKKILILVLEHSETATAKGGVLASCLLFSGCTFQLARRLRRQIQVIKEGNINKVSWAKNLVFSVRLNLGNVTRESYGEGFISGI